MNIKTNIMVAVVLFVFVFGITVYAVESNAEVNYITGVQSVWPVYGNVPVKGEIRLTTTGLSINRISYNTELIPKSTYGLNVYSRYTPVNTSGEYVLVHHSDSTSCSFYRTSDSKNMGVLRRDATNPIGEINEIRWDYTGKHHGRIYFVYGMKFYQMDVVNGNGAPVLIRDFSSDFPGAVKIINDVEGDSSNDSRYWAWQVLGPYSNGVYPRLAIIVYDKLNNKIIGGIKPEVFGKTYLPAPNMVEISPLGTKVITHYGAASTRPSILSGTWKAVGGGVWELSGYKTFTSGNSSFGLVTANGVVLTKQSTSLGAVTDIKADNQYANNSTTDTFWIRLSVDADPNNQKIIADWGKRPEDVGTIFDMPRAWDLNFTNPIVISADETHSGWAWDMYGNELFVSQNNKKDWIEARDIKTGQSTQILQHGIDLSYSNGFHFGKIYDSKYRGWLIMNTTSKTNTHWSENQILMVEIKQKAENPIIWRISPKYSAYNGSYRDESPVALGFDGKTIWYTSNWGTVNGTGDVYRTQLPDTWYDAFPGLIHPKVPSTPQGVQAVPVK